MRNTHFIIPASDTCVEAASHLHTLCERITIAGSDMRTTHEDKYRLTVYRTRRLRRWRQRLRKRHAAHRLDRLRQDQHYSRSSSPALTMLDNISGITVNDNFTVKGDMRISRGISDTFGMVLLLRCYTTQRSG